jgi:MFS family permease
VNGDAQALARGPLRRAIGGLAATQVIGWGSTYYVPAVLAPALRADLALPTEVIFGGVTIMLVVSAGVAPVCGRYMERHGARRPLMLGSAMVAAALALLSQAQGLWTYVLPWILIGLATPLALSQAALTAVAERAGGNARRAVSTLLLISGFSASVFWPLTTWLAEMFGWRGACLVFAAVHLLVCAPVHALALSRETGLAGHETTAAGGPVETPVPAQAETLTFVLLALAMSVAGFVSWGLPLQAVAILTGVGHAPITAVWIATLMGPAQVLARFTEVAFGHRIGILRVGVIAASMMPLVTVLPVLLGHSVGSAVLFVVGYGLSAGAMTIVRSVLPLTLFGRQRYARLLGQLAVPQNTAFAVAPIAFASVMDAFGPDGVLLMAGGAALIPVGALIGLAAVVRRAARPSG